MPGRPLDGVELVKAGAETASTDGAGTRRRALIAACAVLVATGLAASLAAALVWHASVRAHERQSLQVAAADVSGTLETQLRRDTDYVRAVQAVLAQQPSSTASDFRRWFSLLEDHQAQPGQFGALVVKAVPAGGLASFQAQRDADPAFRALVGGRVEPVLYSGRSRHCLLLAGSADIAYAPEFVGWLQGDWCDPYSAIGGYAQGGTTRAKFTQEITDNAATAVYTTKVPRGKPDPTGRALIVEVPVYREGAPLANAQERQAAVVGWVLGCFDVDALLQSALGQKHGLAVALYHASPGLKLELIGTSGTSLGSFQSRTTLALDGRWVIDVHGAPVVGGPSASMQGLSVFFAGAIGTLLLLALVLVLARSRSRAMTMVEEKTVELRHQALHDALTGLPNRVLALDRAQQMLAHARREQRPVAALYVDVDGFKQVNDTFGHAAGDELLRIVAHRLASVVREGDTAARLAGDEFVLLLGNTTLDVSPELVAERVLEALRQPYEMIDQAARQLKLTASIGIAIGLHENAGALLREADIALYEAKATGRNRYIVFRSAMQTAVQDQLTLQMDLAEALAPDAVLAFARAASPGQLHEPAG